LVNIPVPGDVQLCIIGLLEKGKLGRLTAADLVNLYKLGYATGTITLLETTP